MNILTIYSERYDKNENIINNGMSGKVFIEDGNSGKEFKAIDEALDFIEKSKISIDRIDFNYIGDYGIQKFWKFQIKMVNT